MVALKVTPIGACLTVYYDTEYKAHCVLRRTCTMTASSKTETAHVY